jgi:hypothetical protein
MIDVSDRPLCPRCDSNRIRKAGKPNGIQQFYCNECKRRFLIHLKLKADKIPLICYRCGGSNTISKGKAYRKSRNVGSGKNGICNDCKRGFTQGGRKEVERYRLVLENRIRDLVLPEDIAKEVLHMAVEDIIDGKGYCWNITLRVKEAYREIRGEFGQYGSSHYEYRRQMGEVMKKGGEE